METRPFALNILSPLNSWIGHLVFESCSRSQIDTVLIRSRLPGLICAVERSSPNAIAARRKVIDGKGPFLRSQVLHENAAPSIHETIRYQHRTAMARLAFDFNSSLDGGGLSHRLVYPRQQLLPFLPVWRTDHPLRVR